MLGATVLLAVGKTSEVRLSGPDGMRLMYEEGRFSDLLEQLRRDGSTTNNPFLVAKIQSRLFMPDQALSNFFRCTNDPYLREHALYSIARVMAGRSNTNCAAAFRRCEGSENRIVAFMASTAMADFYSSCGRNGPAARAAVSALSILSELEGRYQTLSRVLGNHYRSKAFFKAGMALKADNNPEYRSYFLKVVRESGTADNQYVAGALAGLAGSSWTGFDDNYTIARALMKRSSLSGGAARYLDSASARADSGDRLEKILGLLLEQYPDRNQIRKRSVAINKYVSELSTRYGFNEASRYYSAIMVRVGGRTNAGYSNLQAVMSMSAPGRSYAGKALNLMVIWKPGDTNVAEVFRKYGEFIRADSTMQSFFFRHSLKLYSKTADAALVLSFITNLPATPGRSLFNARCRYQLKQHERAAVILRDLIVSRKADYYTMQALELLKKVHESDSILANTGKLEAAALQLKADPVNSTPREISDAWLAALSRNPDFHVTPAMVDSVLAGNLALKNIGRATNSTVRRIKYFYDRGLLEEGEIEIFLAGKTGLPENLELAGYFGKNGDPELEMRFAERAEWNLGMRFPAYRVRHDLVSWLYPKWYGNEVLEEAKDASVSPDLVWAVIREESRFRYDAVSVSGACGLMQLMPSTFKGLVVRAGMTNSSITAPGVNIRSGARYLGWLMKLHGNGSLASAGYNAGPGSLERWLRIYPAKDIQLFIELIPYPETGDYVRKVMYSMECYSSQAYK